MAVAIFLLIVNTLNLSILSSLPDKKLIILGSSTLNILYEKGDLSRKALIYPLQPLSFREYLAMKYNRPFPAFAIENILESHIDIAAKLCSDVKGKAYPVYSSTAVDFLVVTKNRRIEIEVGWNNKRRKQIDSLEDGFVFKDGIEIGCSNTIPLYLAGFLY